MWFLSYLQRGLIFLSFHLINCHSGDINIDLKNSLADPVTVELMIVLDKEFNDHFNQSYQKIIDYLAVTIWDLNMKFQTLQTVDITFKVTSLITMKDKKEQPFVEEVRTANGSIKMEDILPKFAQWVYRNESAFTDFDVAILVIGENLVDGWAGGRSYGSSACTKDDYSKTHYSTLVVDAKQLWGHSCGSLEITLAAVLGAPWDTEDNSTCKSQTSIMNYADCGGMQYFFSRCSDDGIREYLKSNNASCLHASSDKSKDVLDTSRAMYSPTVRDQCVMVTQNASVTVFENDNICLNASCYVREKYQQKFVRTIYPVDNTPCGTEKYCFRGRCLPKGFQFKNVGSGKCLHSSSRFGSDDYLVATDCMNSPSPLDKFMVLEKDGLSGILLTTPYSLQETQENADKCLTVDMFKGLLQYQKCLTTDPKSLEWEMIKLENNNEFVLFHRNTNTCAKMHPNLSVGISNDCTVIDKWMLWTLDEGQVLSNGWFWKNSINKNKEEEVISENKETKAVFVSTLGWREVFAALCILLFGVVLGVVLFIEFSKYKSSRNEWVIKYSKPSDCSQTNSFLPT